MLFSYDYGWWQNSSQVLALVIHGIFTQKNLLVCFNGGISSSTPHHELIWSAQTMAACPLQHSMASPLLHTPLSLAIRFFYQKFGQNPWFTAQIHLKTLWRDPSPTFHPPSQPHIMMAACPPHCPTPLLTTTLSSPPNLPNVCDKV